MSRSSSPSPLLNPYDSKEEGLSVDEERLSLLERQRDQKQSRLWRLTCQALAITNTVSLLLIIFLASRLWNNSTTSTDLLPSPAKSVLSYKVDTWPISFFQSPYAGKPRPELETAWHDLLEHSMTRFEANEIEQLGLTSLKLKDGGYAAQLGAFHELHCIKKIRHWSYRDHYLAGVEGAELTEWSAHIDHCIEMLRLSAMCKADTAVSTFTWLGEGEARTPTIIGTGPHQCVDWDKLSGWARHRSINVSDTSIFA